MQTNLVFVCISLSFIIGVAKYSVAFLTPTVYLPPPGPALPPAVVTIDEVVKVVPAVALSFE